MQLLSQPVTSEIFTDHESEVRSYCRSWPAVFSRAKGVWLTDVDGRRYDLDW